MGKFLSRGFTPGCFCLSPLGTRISLKGSNKDEWTGLPIQNSEESCVFRKALWYRARAGFEHITGASVDDSGDENGGRLESGAQIYCVDRRALICCSEKFSRTTLDW